MKKILMSILIGVVFVLLTGLSAYSNDKVEYIKQTFTPYMEEFIQCTELQIIGKYQSHRALIDESDHKLHYYLIMKTNPYGVITDLYASYQIVLDGNRTMICNEGIKINSQANKYKYVIDRYIIHRDKNYDKETIQPVEVWDKILSHFFK